MFTFGLDFLLIMANSIVHMPVHAYIAPLAVGITKSNSILSPLPFSLCMGVLSLHVIFHPCLNISLDRLSRLKLCLSL